MGPDATTPPVPSDDPHEPAATHVPHTRVSRIWLASWAAAITGVVLIVFILQNTERVEVRFLWLHGTVPLAVALLIAAVGVAVLAMIIATARIAQLRRLFHKGRGDGSR